MRPAVKLALIGGEVTLLAAFTGVGIHLAMQPHRLPFRPPALVLPTSLRLPALPSLPVAAATPASSAAPIPAAAPTPFIPSLFQKFGEQDRNLLLQQWDILRGLTRAVESYVQSHVLEQVEPKR